MQGRSRLQNAAGTGEPRRLSGSLCHLGFQFHHKRPSAAAKQVTAHSTPGASLHNGIQMKYPNERISHAGIQRSPKSSAAESPRTRCAPPHHNGAGEAPARPGSGIPSVYPGVLKDRGSRRSRTAPRSPALMLGSCRGTPHRRAASPAAAPQDKGGSRDRSVRRAPGPAPSPPHLGPSHTPLAQPPPPPPPPPPC